MPQYIKKQSRRPSNKYVNKEKSKSLKNRLSVVQHPYTIRPDVGLEDPNGLHLNPLNNKPYSPKYNELSKIWTVLSNRYYTTGTIFSTTVNKFFEF